MIIIRYFFREIIYTLLALTALLLLIYISHRFMLYLVQAASGSIAADFILQLLGLKLLSDLMLILPLAFFLAILLALGRLYKDNEMTALAACGVGVPLGAIVGLGTLFAFCVALLSLFLAPWAEHEGKRLASRASADAEISGIAAGRFKEFLGGQGIFYVENLENRQFQHIFAQANHPEQWAIITAQRGEQVLEDGELYFFLQNGYRYQVTPEQLDYTKIAFAEHRILIPRLWDEADGFNHETLPTTALWGVTDVEYQAELQWRLSLPLSVILLATLAVPLSRTTPRQGQYAKIFFGILIYLIYNNLLNIAKKWVERGDVSPELGLWWVHGLLVIIIAFFLYWPYWRNQRHAKTILK
ncbi:LPS export ABC transporter permease LptF [Thioflexithrix psekupsensis]|uniref:Lipopolysaccharide export system permease protein LptF n=1 Tax=Thioflexithrix psekupsensis TaxID=1570016 RepID=A0A251X983_9GAMM|nr:LPS export ABC transporter permease LptF [Thioflexithrix psekupsensis]OUD14354.1 LPS export ABC transporter permease LptF [Thioflexithrix psekupsensis]